MPKIPVYEASLNAPRGAALDVSSSQTYMPFASAVSQTGAMLEQRGNQLLEEHDKAQALDAFNQLRTISRPKLVALLNKEGSQALGVQKEYDEWSVKVKEDIVKNNLSTFSQKEMFNKLAEQRKQSDLDNLASHEVKQDRIYKTSMVKGLAGVTELDIRSSAFDDDKVGRKVSIKGPNGEESFGYTGMIGDYHNAVDGVFKGVDKTAEKLASVEVFRVAQMETLIDSDPKYATGKLEELKPELGSHYSTLKKRLENKVGDVTFNTGYTLGIAKFGQHFEAARNYFNDPEKFDEWGGNATVSAKLDARFSGMITDRERAHQIAESRENERIKKNDLQFYTDNLDKNKTIKPDAIALARDRQISAEALRWSQTEKAAHKTNDPLTVYNIETLSNRALGNEELVPIFITSVTDAVSKGLMTDDRGAMVLKTFTDAEVNRAKQYITRALDPGQNDRLSGDKALKFADAMDTFDIEYGQGKRPGAIAKAIVDSYTADIYRTIKNLPIPEFLIGEKTDMAALDAAQRATESAYAKGAKGWTLEKYKQQMRFIEDLKRNANEYKITDDVNKQMKNSEEDLKRLEIRRRNIN